MTNTTYTQKVLVLGSDIRSFLSVIRSLGREKIDVHVAWYEPGSAALYSRYIKKTHDIPRADSTKANWLQKFIEILKSEHFSLVIPCDDQSIIPLQYSRAKLEKYATIYLLDDNTFDICNSKVKTTELAKSLNICIPNYIIASNKHEVINFAKEYTYPIVLKPISSFTKHLLNKRLEVKKAFNYDELLKFTDKMFYFGKLQIQENFIGIGVGIEVLANNGRILTAFQHERVHEPMMGGGSSYRKSAQLDKDLFSATTKLIAALNYTGVAMIEFKVNKDLNKWILVEINARFWGSLPLSIASGINFPYWLYQMIVFNKTIFPREYKNLYCRNTSLDFYWLISNFKADRNNPTLSSLPLYQVALEAFNILTFRERNDTLQLDDLKPGIIELAKLANNMFDSVGKKVTLRLKDTYLYRKYQFYRCRRSLSHARNILFVCYGNICRSPFAKLYAQKILPSRFTITSCGLHKKANRKPPKTALTAASKFNINMNEHRSAQINEDIVNEADIIFTFDDMHYQLLVQKYPSSEKHTFMISSLNMELPRIIDDPFNKSDSYFNATYKAIIESLTSFDTCENFVNESLTRLTSEISRPKIIIKELNNQVEFKYMKDEWTKLLQNSNVNHLFLSWEWQYTWWETWAKALDLKLFLLIAYCDEKLVGIAPLYIDHMKLYGNMSVRRLQFIGNAWRKNETVRTEYLEFISLKDQSTEVCAAFTDYLSKKNCWDEFVICDLQKSSDTYQQILKYKKNNNWYIDIANKDQGIKIKVTGDFKGYTQALGCNTRLKLFNRRKYLNSLGDVTHDSASYNNLNHYLSILNSLHKTRWGEDCFSEPSLNFHKTLINRLNDKQSYSISCLNINHKPISVLYNLMAGNTVYNIQSGFNQTFDKKLSLGTLHMGYAIEDSFNNPNIVNFDMLAGSGKTEFYKSKYKGARVDFITLRITNKQTLKLLHIINRLAPRKIKNIILKILALIKKVFNIQ